VGQAQQVHQHDPSGQEEHAAHQHRLPAQLAGVAQVGGHQRRGLPVAEPAMEVLRHRVAGRAHAEHAQAGDRHGDPQQVQSGQAPDPRQAAVEGDELLEPEHQYPPSSPKRLASESAPITRTSPTRPWNRPTAVAKLSWLFWMPAVYTKVSKISPTSRFIELSSRNMCSKPSSRKSPIDRMNSTMMVGRIAGRVMCQVCFQRLAPSISAASYRAMSTAVSAAR